MANDIRLIQLNNYVKPEIVEDKRNEWVLNGKDNQYFQYVNERYIGSPTNATILNAYKNLTLGKGLRVRNASKNATQYAEMLKALPKKDVRKMVADYVVYNNAALQIVPLRNGKKVASYIDVTKLAFEKCDEQGNIKGFYYSKDWSNIRKNPPTHLKAFGYGGANEVEILYINDNADDSAYYSLPTYQSGLQYAEMEEEISNYYISHIKNGFSFGYIVNMNGGVPPTEDERQEIERRVKAQMTGSSNAGKIIISFNEGKDAAVEIVPLEVSDSHKQWENINQQSEEKIMRSHGVVSPMLFGVKNSTGLGNNAEELETGLALTMDMRVNPMQNIIIEHLQDFLTSQDIVVDLYFEPLNAKEQIQEEIEESRTELNVTCSGQDYHPADDLADDLIDLGENIEIEGWEIFSIEDVIDDETELERDNQLTRLTSTGRAIPNAKSEQDTENFKIRYRYAPLTAGANSRQFCKKMVAANKVYRKEDILRMGTTKVNPGFGVGGSDTYSIWLYKGGARCNHKWQRITYVKKATREGGKKSVDVNSPNAETISTAEARRRGDRTRNPKEVSMKPKDMPNEGFVNPR